jgi:hypothetical protein
MTDALAIKPVPPSGPKMLHAAGLGHQADYHRSTYFLSAQQGVTVDDLMRPMFWAHHVSKLRMGDLIEAVAEDGSFDVLLRVIDRGAGFVRMRLLREWQNREVAEASAADTKTEAAHSVQAKRFPCVDFTKATKWRVLAHDGTQVIEGLATEGEAKRHLEAYIKRSEAAA